MDFSVPERRSDLVQNRAVLTVSNRRVRGDRYRFGLTVPWHHGKTNPETLEVVILYYISWQQCPGDTNSRQFQNNFTFSRLPR